MNRSCCFSLFVAAATLVACGGGSPTAVKLSQATLQTIKPGTGRLQATFVYSVPDWAEAVAAQWSVEPIDQTGSTGRYYPTGYVALPSATVDVTVDDRDFTSLDGGWKPMQLVVQVASWSGGFLIDGATDSAPVVRTR